jgi:hypothetical protein
MNKELCKKFKENSSRNPKTNRKIKINGPTYKKLNKQCEKILKGEVVVEDRRDTNYYCDKWKKNPGINPKTNRKIKIKGPTYKKLKKECDRIVIESPIVSRPSSLRISKLTPVQKNALDKIKKIAKKMSDSYTRIFMDRLIEKYEDITKIKQDEREKFGLLSNFMKYIRNSPSLSVHFDKKLMDKFYESGRLKTVFETKKRNKKHNQDRKYLNQRKRFEREVFKYPNNTSDKERPKYGCFNVIKNKKGCALLYGDYWLRLHNNLMKRVTFTPGDSLNDFVAKKQKFIGTIDHMYHILYFTEEQLFTNMVRNFIDPEYYTEYYTRSYLEFQIHGDVTFKDNVAQLYYPKGQKGKSKKFCEKYNCEMIYNNL